MTRRGKQEGKLVRCQARYELAIAAPQCAGKIEVSSADIRPCQRTPLASGRARIGIAGLLRFSARSREVSSRDCFQIIAHDRARRHVASHGSEPSAREGRRVAGETRARR
jgi:hypothetical protein